MLIPMFCCLLFLSGVAQASSFKAALKETKRNLKAEEVSEAYQNIRPHLTGLEKRDKNKLRKIFRKYDDFFTYSLGQLTAEYGEVDDILSYKLLEQATDGLRDSAPKDRNLDKNYEALDMVIIKKTVSKEIDLAFGDELESQLRYNVPASEESGYETALFNNTLERIQRDQKVNSPTFGFLMKVIEKKGAASQEAIKAIDYLDDIPLTARQLKRGKAPQLFPDWASKRLEEITTSVFFETGKDFLLKSDLEKELQQKELFVRAFDAPTSEAHVEVSEEQYHFMEIPPMTMRQTLARTDVAGSNFFSAALLMPEYSTLQWDITSGGTEVSYGYVVTVTKGDKEPIQFIVSDRFSKEWAKCSPPQIINAYGGSSSLNFVPTQYTNSCNRHAQRMNYKEVRKEIIKDLVKNITRRLTSIKVSSTSNDANEVSQIIQSLLGRTLAAQGFICKPSKKPVMRQKIYKHLANAQEKVEGGEPHEAVRVLAEVLDTKKINCFEAAQNLEYFSFCLFHSRRYGQYNHCL